MGLEPNTSPSTLKFLGVEVPVELKLTSILLYRNPLNAFLIEVPNEAQVERIDMEIPNGPKLKGYIYI